MPSSDELRTGRLLFPALRWDERRGFAQESDTIETSLEIGVGGFIIFGGDAAAVRELVDELQRRSDVPLLIGSDLERGAGQQFRGATQVPPAAALGALDDVEVTRRAAELTAREAVAVGVNWVYAPVADVDLEPQNPIIGSRAFGSDPERVAAHVAAWVRGCRDGGALPCAKHFPGHGRTVADSHVELPAVPHGRETLEADLLPFREAVRAGVDSMMTAHVAYPALDPSGVAATLSRRIVTELLREEIGFTGLIATDALVMEGILEAGSTEGVVAVRALAAGCDALLYPKDPLPVAETVSAAIGKTVPAQRVRDALDRIGSAADRAEPRPVGEWGREEDRRWALEVAVRSLRPTRGRPALRDRAVDVITIDDDVGGPYPPAPRDAFPAALRAAGLEVREATEAEPGRFPVVALYSDIRAWKGRPGLSTVAKEAVGYVVSRRPDAIVVLFGHPRLTAGIPDTAPVLSAWGGEALMQEAAAQWLTERPGEG